MNPFRRAFTPLLCSVAFAFVLTNCIPCRAQQKLAHLTILHWNDFHAQNVPFFVTRQVTPDSSVRYKVGGSARLLGYILQIKDHRDDVAVLNAGDDFQGTPISTLTFGRSQIEIMNLIHPDAQAIGNHEFDYGIDSLKINIRRARYPILCANVVSVRDNRPLALPYLVTTLGRVKTGIIGLAPPDLELLTLKTNLEGYRMRDIDSTLDMVIHEMKTQEHPDLIILISHMGLDRDTLLAIRRHDIDVIVGGHSHTALSSPIKKNKTIVVQAGSKGQYLGKLDLTVDLSSHSVVDYAGTLIETNVDSVVADSAVSAVVQNYEVVVDSMLGEVIGTLGTRWDRQDGKKVEINIGDFECDIMRSATHTDIAFYNVGGIRKDLDAGPITVRDIWEINPFGNTLVTFSVRGDTLTRMMGWQCSVRPREFVQVSGLKYHYDSSRPDGKQLLFLKINEQPVVDTMHYTVCTNNYIGSHISDFFGIPDRAIYVTDTGLVDRDVIIDFVRHHPVISSSIEGRISDVLRKLPVK